MLKVSMSNKSTNKLKKCGVSDCPDSAGHSQSLADFSVRILKKGSATPEFRL